MASQSAYAGKSAQHAIGSEILWTNIGGLVGSPPGDYAENKESGGPNTPGQGVPLFGSDYGFTLTEQQSVTGLQASFWAYAVSPGGGTGYVYTTLAYNNSVIGVGKSLPGALTNSPKFYTLGGSTDTWGLSPTGLWTTVQSSLFGGSVTPSCLGPVNGTEVDIFVAWLPITVFHT